MSLPHSPALVRRRPDRAVHPLDAPPEQKLFRADLGRMPLTPHVRLALLVLQGYLGLMVLLAGWKLIAGI